VKIVTSDQNQLVATDKATSGLIIGFILVLLGIGIAVAFFAGKSLGGLIGLALIAFGVLAIVSHKARTLTIDKGAGSMTLNVKSIFGSKDYPYATADALKIQLVQSVSQEYVGGGGPGMAGREQTEEKTQLLLVLKNGTTIDLADAQRNMSSFGIFGKVPNQGVGQQIATFLGVPFETAGPPTLGQVVQGVQTMLKGGGAPSFLPGQPPVPPPPPPPPAQTQPQPSEPDSQKPQGL
jgi:hypothetical protein